MYDSTSENKKNTDKFYEHKMDIFKVPILSRFKVL